MESAKSETIRDVSVDDHLTREQKIAAHAGLVRMVALRLKNGQTDLEDLIQWGQIGLIQAVDRFDPARGTRFSTFAVPYIAGEIRRFLRDDGSVKVSRGLKERSAAIKMTRSRMTAELGREPTVGEISREMGLSVEEIATAETATAATESIQRETGEDGFTLENVLTDSDTEEQLVERIALREAIGKLPEREALVINLRYFHGLTQERVARVLQVSQVQVSRIEKKALGHLREMM